MRVVINHLTRMQKGFICAAGIDLATKRHVRPVLASLLRSDLLSVHGGPFALRRIIDLGPTHFVGMVPEIEDRQFKTEQVKANEDMPSDEFRQLLQSVAKDELTKLFGPELVPVRTTCAIPERRGLHSLGVLQTKVVDLLLEPGRDGLPRVRLVIDSKWGLRRLPVTGIDFYAFDHVTPDETAVSQWADILRSAPTALLSVGLSRPYRGSSDEAPMHWLQVNNVFV